jgi:hypothetical protein
MWSLAVFPSIDSLCPSSFIARYYFWGSAARFSDLLTLLEMSVCGPEGYSIAHAATASPQRLAAWQQSRRASEVLAASRKRLQQRGAG